MICCIEIFFYQQDICSTLRPGGMGSMELIEKNNVQSPISESDIEMRNPLNVLTNDTVEILLMVSCSIYLKG